MKFPDAEQARAWYDSAEYHDVRPLRWATATSNMALIPELDPAALEAGE